jgi:hypothetical protein
MPVPHHGNMAEAEVPRKENIALRSRAYAACLAGRDRGLGGWCFSSRRGGPPASLIVSGESWWWRGVLLGWSMTLGLAERQGDLFDDVDRFCEAALPVNSVFAVLHRERDGMFPDEMFADLFAERGRRSVPPSVVATVMVLQRLEGLSDREAVERYSFDARWRYAAGVGGYDGAGWGRFAHTVLVDMRARLGASDDPCRIFRVTLDAASAAGLVGAKRVLDSRGSGSNRAKDGATASSLLNSAGHPEQPTGDLPQGGSLLAPG